MKSSRDEHERLSRREEQVMHLLADGKTTREIAKRFGLSMKTVQTYVGRIKEKWGLRNMNQVIRFAVISRYCADSDKPVLK